MIGRRLRGLPKGGGSGYALPYLSDLVSVQPAFAGSMNRVLIRGYSGSLFRLRKGASTTQDFSADFTGWVDFAAVYSFCNGNDVFLDILRNQTGAGHPLTAPGTTNQPKVWDASTGPTLLGVRLAGLWDGSNDNLNSDTSPSGYGFSTGNVAFTVASVGSGTGRHSGIGGANAAQSFSVITRSTSDTDCSVNINGSQRTFGCADVTQPNIYIGAKAASVTVASYRCRQNGVELSQSAITNGTTNLNLVDTGVRMGSNANANASFLTGKLNFLAFWTSLLSDADMLGAETEMRRHI
jgi:hypothetical protein